jgi:hypothetical protein
MSGTSMALVKQALVDQLTTLYASNSNVQVLYGPRGPITRADVVMVGNLVGTVEPSAMGPSRPRFEDYVVDVVISCTRNAADQSVATAAACALYDQLQVYLRSVSSENLGVAGVIWARATGAIRLVEADNPELSAANTAITVSVSVRARIV